MPIEDRVTALEQGLAATQLNFVQQLTENNQRLATLNKVISAQELHTREIDHNITILLGVVSGQERDIKEMKERLERLESRMGTLSQQMDAQFTSVNQKLDAITARLTSGKPPTRILSIFLGKKNYHLVEAIWF